MQRDKLIMLKIYLTYFLIFLYTTIKILNIIDLKLSNICQKANIICEILNMFVLSCIIKLLSKTRMYVNFMVYFVMCTKAYILIGIIEIILIGISFLTSLVFQKNINLCCPFLLEKILCVCYMYVFFKKYVIIVNYTKPDIRHIEIRGKIIEPREEECTICYEKNINYELNICHHVFHKECINEWNKKSSTCPLCRTINI